MPDITAIDDDTYEPPSGKIPGRILVHVLGKGEIAYRWETEVLDYDGNSAVFWINEGVGFDYFFDSIDFPHEGKWVVNDVTVSWTKGDGCTTDDDEHWEWGEITPATAAELPECDDDSNRQPQVHITER